MIIHCSDFAGNVKPYDISLIWSQRVNKEFTSQVKQIFIFIILMF